MGACEGHVGGGGETWGNPLGWMTYSVVKVTVEL